MRANKGKQLPSGFNLKASIDMWIPTYTTGRRLSNIIAYFPFVCTGCQAWVESLASDFEWTTVRSGGLEGGSEPHNLMPDLTSLAIRLSQEPRPAGYWCDKWRLDALDW